MYLRRFLVYDAATGEIVHVHVESAALGTSAAEVLEMVPAGARRLAVVEQMGTEFSSEPVRVENGAVRKGDATTPMASGGVGRRFSQQQFRRTYSRISSSQTT